MTQMEDLAGVPFEQMSEDFRGTIKQFIDEKQLIDNDLNVAADIYAGPELLYDVGVNHDMSGIIDPLGTAKETVENLSEGYGMEKLTDGLSNKS